MILDLVASIDGMVPMGSAKSVLSIIGIIWLVFWVPVACSGFKGWLTSLCMVFLMMLMVGLFCPSETGELGDTSVSHDSKSLALYVYNDGRFYNIREWIRQDSMAYEERKIPLSYGSFLESRERAGLGTPDKYYKMHVPDRDGGNGLEWWVYHPDAWWWAPAIGCIIGLLIHPTWALIGVLLGSMILNRK